jgi:uncharacterized membrane protein YhaH (DUF805 family)
VSDLAPLPSARPGPIARTLDLWFSLRAPVGRAAYAASGFALMGAKYGIEAALVYLSTGTLWPPLAFVSPLYSIRAEILGPAPSWLVFALGLLTLPFLWIGVGMSVRRAANAGLSAWTGVLFLVPIVNFLLMATLALLPDKAEPRWQPVSPGPYRAGPAEQGPPSLHLDHGLKSALSGILCAVGFGLTMLSFSVYALELYGTALFFVTPFVMGAMSALIYNRPSPQPLGATLVVSFMSLALTGSAILLFALEGFICLLMAFPIAVVVGLLGSVVGRAIALQSPTRALPPGTAFLFLIAPGTATLESAETEPPRYEVATAIEVDAPPEVVWRHVIGFSELPAPSEWVFDTGIAYPLRATIQGEGVGAVRHCEFTTGPFVEPITVWEPPSRLGFDVASQPPSMKEWSPYADVHPPHLEHAIVSRRGEFRLVALPGGRTRLEGSTWYELSMSPDLYWKAWSDSLLHTIHGRVLRHVKALSEADTGRQSLTAE